MPGLNLTPSGAVPPDLLERIEAIETAVEEGGTGGTPIAIGTTAPTDQTPVWIKTPS